MIDITEEEAHLNVGLQCCEIGKQKPFKSGNKINTIRGVIDHPILHIPAYVFKEDESFVECRRCRVIDEV